MRVGQTVEMRYSAARLRGQVTRVYLGGSFKVTYPAIRDDRGHRVGQRFTYPASSAASFTVIT